MNTAPPKNLPSEFPPPWAGGWGEDRYGVFAEIVVKDVATEMRWIPPGRFAMGSPANEAGRWKPEAPVHSVTISRGFWLAATPCTQRQWMVLADDNPSKFKGDDRPIEQVSWDDCQKYCAGLNKLLPGLEARLPTEAEWEYACRAGTRSAFYDGSACTEPEGKDPALDRLGWYRENSSHETHPVAEKVSNAWGLFDLHGNVWEWCFDGFRKYREGSWLDPIGPLEGGDRVVRGGSWHYSARYCRSAIRSGLPPGNRSRSLGFRLAAGQLPPEAVSAARSAGRGAEGADVPGPRDEASAPRLASGKDQIPRLPVG